MSEHNNHQPPEYGAKNNSNSNSNNNGQASLENAVLDSMHTSTTESVLQWPHFDVFPSLRNDYVSIFELEQARPPVKMRATSILCPFVSDEDMEAILEAFQGNANFWYPTLSRHQLDKVRLMVKCFNAGTADQPTVESCLAHLVMALGCASQTVAGLISGASFTEEEMKRRAQRREMGDLYFDHALRRLHVAHMEVGSVATQCLFFTAWAPFYASSRNAVVLRMADEYQDILCLLAPASPGLGVYQRRILQVSPFTLLSSTQRNR